MRALGIGIPDRAHPGTDRSPRPSRRRWRNPAESGGLARPSGIRIASAVPGSGRGLAASRRIGRGVTPNRRCARLRATRPLGATDRNRHGPLHRPGIPALRRVHPWRPQCRAADREPQPPVDRAGRLYSHRPRRPPRHGTRGRGRSARPTLVGGFGRGDLQQSSALVERGGPSVVDRRGRRGRHGVRRSPPARGPGGRAVAR